MVRVDDGRRVWGWGYLGAACAAGFLSIGSAAPGAGSSALAPGPVIDLQPRAVHSERLARDQHRDYRVSLPAGQAAEVVFRQLGAAGVMLQWTGDARSPHPPLEPLHVGGAAVRLTLIAEANIRWQLRVAAARSSTPAEYSIVLEQPHAVTAADRHRAAAEQSLASAEVLRRAKDQNKVQEALELYREALAGFRAARDGCGVRAVYLDQAALQDVWADYAGSLDSAERALRQACDGDTTGQAMGFTALGSAKANQGDFVGAVDALERAATLLRQAGDTGIRSGVLGNLAQDYLVLGETQKSLDAAQAQLELARQSGNRWYVVYARKMIADARAMRGELAPALAGYWQALEDLRAATPDPELEGEIRNSLGSVYRLLGDGGQARESYRKAQALFASMQQWRGLAETAIDQGDSLLDDGDPGRATEVYQRALNLGKTHHLDDVTGEALRGLARCEMARHRWDRARALLNAALREFGSTRASANGVRAFTVLGDLDRQVGDLAAARASYEKALALARRSQDAFSQADLLAHLARVAVDDGELLRAAGLAQRSLDQVESERARLAEPVLRTDYFSTRRGLYALDIEILMQLHARHPAAGYAAAALAASERARARSVQDQFVAREVTIRRGLDPKLVAAVRAAERRVHVLAYRRAQAQSQASKQERRVSDGALDAAVRQLDRARGKLYRSAPRFAELIRPVALTRGERRRLLDADTEVLEYWLGDQRSYLWVVGRDRLTSYVLPPRAQLEADAEALLRALQTHAPAVGTVAIARLAAREAQATTVADKLERTLGARLLPASAGLDAGNLVIVADGALARLPFEVLRPGGDAAALGADHDLTYLPSITTLRWLRDVARPARSRPSLAVFADPVFQADDARLHASSARPPAPLAATLKRAAADVELTALQRLRYSQREARSIAALAAPDPVWLATETTSETPTSKSY